MIKKIEKISILFIFIIFLVVIKDIETTASWVIEDVLVSEEKENISFLDRLRGKKAETIRTYEKRYKYLEDDEDEESYVRNNYKIIEEEDLSDYQNIEKDSIYGYKYYFDNDGYLMTNTITPDYEIVDTDGKVIDKNLVPILYKISGEGDSKEDVYVNTKQEIDEWVKEIIIDKSVQYKNVLTKVFNSKIDKIVQNHIVGGIKYKKNINGKI